MDNKSEETQYYKLTQDATGSIEYPTLFKFIQYPLDKYIIKVELTEDNKFVGISEVRVNKDFLDYKQKITTKGFHDVEEYYREQP